LGFEDLKRVALNALNSIAAQSLQSSLLSLFGGSGGGGNAGLGNFLGQALNAFLGMPGRATGGPVAPSRGYIVGENGPELFVPTSAGRIETDPTGGTGRRDVRVAIQLATPPGTAAPTAMRRSSRQIASAVRRAIQDS
jgi:hypothetical protein